MDGQGIEELVGQDDTRERQRAGGGPGPDDRPEALEDLRAAQRIDLDRVVAQDRGEARGLRAKAVEDRQREGP